MENFWDGGHSVCRNPLLQKMFVFVGVGEKAGRGADIISTGWRDNGWQLPTLSEHQMPARVEAVLLIEDLVKQSEVETTQKSNQNSGLENEIDVGNGLKSNQKTAKEAESNQKSNWKILEAISKNPVITIKELQETTGLSESGVKKILRKLRAIGRIRRVGPDKGGHWEIVG